MLKNHEFETDSFGVMINLITNTVRPSTKINISKKSRGVSSALNLDQMTDEQIDKAPVTKRKILRVCMQLYSVLGEISSIPQLNGKLILANIKNNDN